MNDYKYVPSKDLECPYCGEGLDVCHDDGMGYEESVAHQMECSNCEKWFTFQTSVSFYYEPSKADCLNDGEHDFKPTTTYPVRFTQMKCTMCEELREPTEAEMKLLLENE